MLKPLPRIMQFAIETKCLTKNFDELVALNKISISIKQGELFGILGPNGAGKTTLINILSTMDDASSGEAKVLGVDVAKDPSLVRQNIGVVFQDATLDDRLTGRENLDLHARLYGLDDKLIRKKRTDEVLALVGLSDRADSIVKTYSGGMSRRLEIARGFIHKPHILFLDEPTIGLDPQTRFHIWEYIKILIKEGMTIVLTTHYMEEADRLCDRIAIIDHGEIVALDSPEALKNTLGGDVIILKVKYDIEKLCDIYKNKGFAKIVSQKNDEIFITVIDGEKQIPNILSIASSANIPVMSVSLHKPALDDVFLNYTGHEIRDNEMNEPEGHRIHQPPRPKRRKI